MGTGGRGMEQGHGGEEEGKEGSKGQGRGRIEGVGSKGRIEGVG